MAFIFRTDNTNVGDWYCSPSRYFPFRLNKVYDILDIKMDVANERLVIVGGGGLGQKYFLKHIKRLSEKSRNYKLIAWGVGVDEIVDRNNVLDDANRYELYGEWFKDFDEIGIRVFSEDQKYRYVPCVSCLHPDLFKFREIKPQKLIGIYSHKRVTLMPEKNASGLAVCDNSGADLQQKLEFISKHEYIVTNTYHGVYWATLLNRKVICIPYKSGCFSFKHRPAYSGGDLSDEILHSAKNYPDSLEECRLLNLNYYSYLIEKYGDF